MARAISAALGMMAALSFAGSAAVVQSVPQSRPNPIHLPAGPAHRSGSRGVNMGPHNKLMAKKRKVRNRIARASRKANRRKA